MAEESPPLILVGRVFADFVDVEGMSRDAALAEINRLFRFRGKTLLAVVLDEIGFWMPDEFSSNPDREVYRAVAPSLAQSGGPLIAISSPYRKTGLLHEKHKAYFGVDNDRVLFVQGASSAFNPTLDQEMIAEALTDDAESGRSEWLGEFRSDLASFLSDDLVDAALDCDRPLELPPLPGVRYHAFTDPSGGRNDAYCICVGHREGERFVADVVRGRQPPFDPQVVTAEYAALVGDYRIKEVTGDNYSAEWVVGAWAKHGVKYTRSDKTASELFIEALPLFTRSAISVPDFAPLARELRALERRTTRMGRDLVSHPAGLHDDHAVCAAGCAWLAASRKAPLKISDSVLAQSRIVSRYSARWRLDHPYQGGRL